MKRIFTLFTLLCVTLFGSVQAQERVANESIKSLLTSQLAKLTISKEDLQQAKIINYYKDAKTGIEYVYLQQTFNGIEVYNQIITLAFRNKALLYKSGNFIKHIERKGIGATPSLTAKDALLKAAAHLKLANALQHINIKASEFETDKKFVFSAAGIAKKDIEVKLFYAADSAGALHLTWNVNIDVAQKPDWWNIRVDALSGTIVKQDNWTVYETNHPQKQTAGQRFKQANSSTETNSKYNFFAPPNNVNSASYYVIPYPADNKNVTGFTSVTNPWENAGSGNHVAAFGWQYDGTTNYNITRGNNVYAYEDTNHDNTPGRSASSITSLPDLQFTAKADFAKQPTDSVNMSAAIINLFYWNNIMHDMMYQYGFDEGSGNFQNNNIERGGSGSDFVLAEAQDGSGINNANFATPGDGASPRMQMYLWSAVPTLNINSPADVAGLYTTVESDVSPFNKLATVGPVSGSVVYYSRTDTLGCGVLSPSNDSVKGKVALLFRGTCAFTEKILNAQNAGAIAVIVVNNAGAPLIMSGLDSSITIPAVMISTEDGTIISAAIRAGENVTATLANSGINLDGDFDNGIICHEYGHGVSNRLTGGANNASCLNNEEQAGEGWSDYIGLMMTTDWKTETLTDGATPRGVGTYAFGEGVKGNGIRTYPYSTDMTVDPHTYADLITNTEVHAIGEIWCSALWDMTWNIIGQEGTIEGNLYNANSGAGNTIALNLVLEGMRLQPCLPGFLDSRDAILAADSILYGYKHKCAIWNAFARRGMGVSAVQGSANNATDQTAAFDVPSVTLTQTTEPVFTKTGEQLTQTVTATCGCEVPADSYSIKDTIPDNFTYVSSSGGSLSGSIVTFPVTFSTPLEVKTYSVTITPSIAGCAVDSVVYDDRDSHTRGGFTSATLAGNTKWVSGSAAYHSANHSWFAADSSKLTHFTLTSGNFKPTGLSLLSFWHLVNTEYGFDGGLVELQANGGSWMDAAPYFTKNGYNAIINTTNNSLPQTTGFTGMPFASFSQSLIDLSSFTNDSVRVRFRMRSDSVVGAEGWYVDDITVANGCGGLQSLGLYTGNETLVQSFKIPVYVTSNVLPLSLMNFTVTAEETSALLEWQTASEVNTQGFEVEVSPDGTAYTSLGSVTAKGQTTNNYRFYDLNPYNGWNYYRIKIVDKNGSFTYSAVQSLLFARKGLLVVKPNPAVNSTVVYFDKNIVVNDITITDMQGKILKQIPAKNISGSYTINTTGFASGTYLVRVSPASGSPVTVKLVVHH